MSGSPVLLNVKNMLNEFGNKNYSTYIWTLFELKP